jgi:hypothetical protein
MEKTGDGVLAWLRSTPPDELEVVALVFALAELGGRHALTRKIPRACRRLADAVLNDQDPSDAVAAFDDAVRESFQTDWVALVAAEGAAQVEEFLTP